MIRVNDFAQINTTNIYEDTTISSWIHKLKRQSCVLRYENQVLMYVGLISHLLAAAVREPTC